MKKLLLLFAFVSITLSCSSNDDDNTAAAHKVSFKINGVTVFFDNVTVTNENEGSYLDVEATNGNQTVSFLLFPESTPSTTLLSFEFTENTIFYSSSDDLVSRVTSMNMNGGRLKGTFSGTANGFDDQGNVQPSKTITEGQFDFTY